jgi:hypothetical protein
VWHGDSSTAITIEDGDVGEGTGSRDLSTPTEQGDLAVEPLIGLLYRLARKRGTGLLILHGYGEIRKETYLSEGHPQYVSSNMPEDRLGTYLVTENVISKDALARAVAVMGHFGGKLVDTLVGIGVVTPIEAYRLLARQVGAKLIDACGWTEGRYVWRAGRANPWQSRPLHLDAYRIIGAGAMQVPVDYIEAWSEDNVDRMVAPAQTDVADLAAFGLGEAPARVHLMFDGRCQLGDLAARPRSTEARINLLRLVYLLVHCRMARLG